MDQLSPPRSVAVYDVHDSTRRAQTHAPRQDLHQNGVFHATQHPHSDMTQRHWVHPLQTDRRLQQCTDGGQTLFPRGNTPANQYQQASHHAFPAMADKNTMILKGLPKEATISDIHRNFRKFGRPEYIDLFEDGQGRPDGGARLRFESRPDNTLFQTSIHPFQLANGIRYGIQCKFDGPRQEPKIASPVDSRRYYPQRMSVKASFIDFGIMLEPTKMLIKRQTEKKADSIIFGLNLRYEELIVEFPLTIAGKSEKLKFTIPLNRMSSIKILSSQKKVLRILFELEDPPKYFRQIRGTRPSEKAQTWNENDTWFRQTDIAINQQILKSSALTLKRPNAYLDLGRWTTYHMAFDMTDAKEAAMQEIRDALEDFNVEFVALENATFELSQSTPFWSIVDETPEQSSPVEAKEPGQTDIMMHISFEVRYQLEVCISQGVLNEDNLSREFVERLIALDTTTAREVLENAAARKARIFDPMMIFAGHSDAFYANSTAPDYCVLVRSVTVTPTVIKFNTPTVETSNRILRQYAEHSDRFIRVRFAEEGARSKIFATDKNTENEIFTRVKRTFANGIMVGDRKFEFLAFGNSQFREHGAYFFSPLPTLKKEEIRAWMGYFAHIKYVALFAARLGQCFSTTRAISTQARTVEILDIKRNDYCFSDGVGRISPFLALTIADSIGLSQKNREPPSVFQFRLGGCKGVLAVWPTVADKEIHIRETQYKFPAIHEGLEIIRCSQYASANLNRQIILVLSTLGVCDHVFIGKLKAQLLDIETAMTDPTTALKILQRDIDHNQMTLKLAEMVIDGFQERDEPFIKSLLHLWRAWSIKLLKEKARITISKGALLLGCLDETGILRGHFDSIQTMPKGTSAIDRAQHVPQIFVQLSKGPNGTAMILTGPMLLARNPSLHPGDIRVVCGVDVPELRHLKDCVVLPQTGDRDVASMCSGGDLDGDDFEVIWDQDLLPDEWNHEPMDYTPPKRVEHHRDITDDDLTNFFIKYMKNDTLPTIAHAHVAHADMSEQGVKDPKCLQLAALHSKAVDFVKTGQEAIMTQDLRPRRYPHFMEKKNKRKCYTSRKILGQLFDLVERVTFQPDLLTSFDDRILRTSYFNPELMEHARKLKYEYDSHMRRILAQHAINTEFEVWSTFVMQHNHTSDYKMQEEMAHISGALKDQFRKRCIEIAGGKEYGQLAPLVVAMYRVTADEFKNAIEQGRRTVHGPENDKMPFVSFPWLFQNTLGKIAKLNTVEKNDVDKAVNTTHGTRLAEGSVRSFVAQDKAYFSDMRDIEDDLETAKGVTHRGDLLELDFGKPEAISALTMHQSTDDDTESSISNQDDEHLFDTASSTAEDTLPDARSIDIDWNQPVLATRDGNDGDDDDDDASDASSVEDFHPSTSTRSLRTVLADLASVGNSKLYGDLI